MENNNVITEFDKMEALDRISTMRQYAQYITNNTKQEVDGCHGLVVCNHFSECKHLATFLTDLGWTLQMQQMKLTKEGHATLRLIAGTDADVIWRSMCGMQLHHAFIVEGGYDIAVTVMSKLRGRIGNVDRGAHVLGEYNPVMLKLETRRYD